MDEKESRLPDIKSESLPTAETAAEWSNKEILNKEALQIIDKVIIEQDPAKTKDLTYLFNANQNKKAMIRVNKLGELLDTMADQALTRFTKKPDEISNQELLQGMKVVQDIIDKGQKQISGVSEVPLIQINQQNNELNIGDGQTALSKESRDKVKNAVMSLLANIETKEATPADFKDDYAAKVEEVDTTDGHQ